MINSIFTRYREFVFNSAATATSTIFTTTKKSFVSVEWTSAGFSVGARVFYDKGPSNQRVIIAQNDAITNNNTYYQSGGSVVPAGTAIKVSRLDAYLKLHVFEME